MDAHAHTHCLPSPHQEIPERLVVGDDAVVHHEEVVVWRPRGVGVRVDGGGLAVGGPASVCNAGMHVEVGVWGGGVARGFCCESMELEGRGALEL
jgi:hypothetical protein